MQRRELLMRLCLGDLDPFEAIERSHEIGLEIAAAAYAVVVARGNLPPQLSDPALRPRRLQLVQNALLTACRALPGAEPFRKDIEEVVVLIRGADAAEVRAQINVVVERGT